MSPDKSTKRERLSPEEITAELNGRGHVVTSWEELGFMTIAATGIETSQYRIGLPDDEASPTVFRARFPPNSKVEAHTHACDYSEIILEGSQKVGGRWLHEGDVRIGMANRAYGPLLAGPEGVTVLLIFADGRWPAIPVGSGDGATLGTDQLTERFRSA